MKPVTLTVAPTDSLKTILKKLDDAIQSEEATIQAAQSHRDELSNTRAALSKLTTAVEPVTVPSTDDLSDSNGSASAAVTPTTSTAMKSRPAAKPAVKVTTKKPATQPAGRASQAATKPTQKPNSIPEVAATLELPASPTVTTTSLRTRSRAATATKTVPTNVASRSFSSGHYQAISEIPQDTHLPDAIAQLLAGLPDQALSTDDVVRRLYGTLKVADHDNALPQVQAALTAGLRRSLWRRTSQKPLSYQHLPQ